MATISHIFGGQEAPLWLILLATSLLAAVMAFAGAALLWRRMAYFGDALSHAALFGVALALAVRGPVIAGVAVVALLVTAAVLLLRREGKLAHDALLGTFAHGLMALGLLLAYLAVGPELDLHEVLFGDVSGMKMPAAFVIIAGAVVIGALVKRYWEVLVLSAVSEELALAEGRPARRAGMWLAFAIAFTLALAARATGLLLFTSLLVIPVAAARAFATTPEAMAAGGAVIGVVAVSGGIAFAHAFSLPSGPAIVSLAFLAFALFHLAAWLRG